MQSKHYDVKGATGDTNLTQKVQASFFVKTVLAKTKTNINWDQEKEEMNINQDQDENKSNINRDQYQIPT